MATGGSFTDFRFKDSSINITVGETYNLGIEYLPDTRTWEELPYGNASRVSNLTTSNSSVATAEKLITSSNDFYILVTAVGTGSCTISAVCELDSGTKTITCEVTVTSSSNSTGKYLLDSQGNRFSPITSAETVYVQGRTTVKQVLQSKQDIMTAGSGITITDNEIALNTASSSNLGGIKIGNNLSISSGKLSGPRIQSTSYKSVLASAVSAGGTITVPASYTMGKGLLDVYLNGEKLICTTSSDTAGANGHYFEKTTTSIQITSDWSCVAGDVFEFVIRKQVYTA